MQKRKEGYYWCKYRFCTESKWCVYQWNGFEWLEGGISCGNDIDFEEIDENRIVRQEPINLSEFATKLEDIISDCKETEYSWDGKDEVPYDAVNCYQATTEIMTYLKQKGIIHGN